MSGSTTLFLILAMCGVAAGCSIFETREPEDPSGGGQCPWTIPTEPDTLLTNLETTIGCGLAGVVNYERIFAENLIFQPDPEDVAYLETLLGSNPFEGWNKQIENDVFERIAGEVGTGGSMVLELTDIEDAPVEEADAAFQADYTFTITTSTGTTEYGGVARFYMSDNVPWQISRWVDERLGGDTQSWGLLKGSNRQL